MFQSRSLRALALTGAAALALATGPVRAQEAAFDFDAMTPEQQAAFGAQVRAYLLENPQVIMEAVAVLEEREQQAQAAADDSLVQDNIDRLLDDGFSWVGGNPEGDVTVVEFIDYRCGYCRRAHPEVEQLVEMDGNIRLIVKEFPILGEASVISSRFAVATHIVEGDEAYKAVHDALIALEGNPGKGQLRRVAQTLGLDAEAILAEMDSDEVTRRISETRALAQDMQINGTPSFVFGDRMVRGYAPLQTMMQIVEDQRS
ncbi:DsbA family protein [Pseudoponticoccus marisrubri]|uniref:Disulfide bond formation protein DsbA n=1 Tax=Pseudoponticoccus marisrubri TaxID=1685382 RepID=A0A0W7WLZ8_9RHOB|nr:DsbA family protein [Pseudoponticoccus marisrubri]KUF11605.1 disulfide bond formation protein DsbA [Pseudoponticoccus marisrubri]